jgi:hypothetical protein
MPGHWVGSFAAEAQQAGQATFGRVVTVWGVGNGVSLVIGLERLQHRALQIGGQQLRVIHVSLALSLRQQLVAVLDDRMLYHPVNLGGQAAVAIEALMRWLIRLVLVDQTIQWIVPIVAEQSRQCGRHWALRAFKV